MNPVLTACADPRVGMTCLASLALDLGSLSPFEHHGPKGLWGGRNLSCLPIANVLMAHEEGAKLVNGLLASRFCDVVHSPRTTTKKSQFGRHTRHDTD